MTIFHGGGLDAAIARHGGAKADWLDLSTGINPVPWPVPAVDTWAWTRLPDSGALHALEEAARRYYRVPDALGIVAAPGTQALIEMLPRLLPGKTATVVASAAETYREHAHCCAKAGRQVRDALSPDTVPADETLAILVNPNNPDGRVWQAEAIEALAGRLAGTGGMLIVDEAFCDTVPEASVVPMALPGTVVLRSFGKFFGLAGLRLGFAIATPDLAARIAERFGPWAVSGPALAIGAAALADDAWINATRARLQTDSEALAILLERNGFSIVGRNGLFVLGRHRDATRIGSELARRRILVRPFPDRPELVRFGLSDGPQSMARLDAALRDIAGEAA